MNYPNPHSLGCPWHPVAEDYGSPNLKWCEETLCHWISEPANAWSNIGYMIVAVIIMMTAYRNKHRFELQQFGPIVLFMGLMSFFYHQSNFYGSQVLDFLGMFFFVGWAKGMNLIRIGMLKSSQLIPFNLTVALIYLAIMHFMYISGWKFQSLVLVSGFIIILTEIFAQRKNQSNLKWFILSLIIFTIAFSFSVLDVRRVWCDPLQHGWFSQGHALWHWIGSLGMFTFYRHYSLTIKN